MTKAERIRKLDNGKRSTSKIAEMIGCLPSYVRSVRQRARGFAGYAPADLNYLKRKFGGETPQEAWRNRYKHDVKFRAIHARSMARRAERLRAT